MPAPWRRITGSVSVVTFVTATEILGEAGPGAGGYMVAVLALMETPAIVSGCSSRAAAPKAAGAVARPAAGCCTKCC
jgi:hypothetical protein